jgi:hypothetical protein
VQRIVLPASAWRNARLCKKGARAFDTLRQPNTQYI